MANILENLPNYQSHPLSPKVADIGVQITLNDGSFEILQPIVIFGTYQIDQKFIQTAQGAPLTKILLIVVQRDEIGIWHDTVQEAHNIIPIESYENELIDSAYREEGYFNLNLLDTCEMIKEPGRYWVLASMGDYVSDRIEFEVKAGEQTERLADPERQKEVRAPLTR